MRTRILLATFAVFFLIGSAYADTISAQRAADLSLPVGPPCASTATPAPCGFVSQPYSPGSFTVTVQGWYATLILNTTLTLLPGATGSCSFVGRTCDISGTLSYMSTCHMTAGLGPVHCPTPPVVFTATINGTMTQGVPLVPNVNFGSQFTIIAALSNCGPAPITCGEGANLSFAFGYAGSNIRGLGGATSGALPPETNPGNGGNGDDGGNDVIIVDPGGDEPAPEHVPEPSALQGLLLGTGLLALVEMTRRKLQLGA